MAARLVVKEAPVRRVRGAEDAAIDEEPHSRAGEIRERKWGRTLEGALLRSRWREQGRTDGRGPGRYGIMERGPGRYSGTEGGEGGGGG
jgi:hypothetical protein